jgi:hypothetical protein
VSNRIARAALRRLLFKLASRSEFCSCMIAASQGFPVVLGGTTHYPSKGRAKRAR